MQPEISRRCLVCGAAPRAGAQFCPQCGNRLTTGDESPDVRAEAPAGDGRAAAEEPARVVASEEEVVRAFEAWRGGAAVAQDEEPRTRPATTEDETRSSEARSPTAFEASRPEVGAEASRAPLAEASRPAVEGGAEQPRARELVTPEPPMSETPAHEPSSQQQPPPPVTSEADADEAGAESSSSSAAKTAGAVGATRRRAASVVKESIAPRVERVRDRSIVMLEEAPDDSGLRFVLLAAFLFGLFILLLVLSTVIK